MDVVTADQARIAEDAEAVAFLILSKPLIAHTGTRPSHLLV